MKTELQSLFCQLRALSWTHHAAHWQAKGTDAYQDHLLFERLYKDTLDEIDGFAEKLVGLLGDDTVDPVVMIAGTHRHVAAACAVKGLMPRALTSETLFLSAIKSALDSLDLSPGMQNFLEGVADLHETHVYLLKQHFKAGDTDLVRQWGSTLVGG
jgi:DNA-binding ferritin-like protein